MIRILIVDDSKVVQAFLAHILTSDPEMEVVGFANTGFEAIELARINKPDIITMDIHMPGMDGFEATRAIMETIPTPIVIVSGSAKTRELARLFRSVEAGALAIIHRPPALGHPMYSEAHKELIQTVRLMSQVKVVKLFPKQVSKTIRPVEPVRLFNQDMRHVKIIAIGASTGGPVALKEILSGLPESLNVPLLIVQHIAAGFVKGFTEWLSATSGIRLKVAEAGESVKAGIGYIAPDNYHMGLTAGKKILLCDEPPENGCRPSVGFLFRTVAQTMGQNAMGILLTGMGKDGASELKTMKENGAVTIVQDEGSSVVFGMPGEALKIGAASQVLSPSEIGRLVAGTRFRN
ncbi:MAG: chemotaxis-specific protein-glutamate methyltransferase CheB [Bacteroidales bacterium]